jgi:putative tryptophan/tyrosine transport system substrate-binding protein
MIRRRALVVTTGAGALAMPAFALAQGRAAMPRIGFLASASAADFVDRIDAFRSGLLVQGLVEGRNLSIDYRWAEGQLARLPALASELVQSKVEVIVSVATPATLAAKGASATTPIVMTTVGDAVASGIVTNLARPERNVTGLTFFLPQLAAKRVELLKEAVPGLVRAAVLVNPENQTALDPVVQAIQSTAAALKLTLQQFPVSRREDIGPAFLALIRWQADGVVVLDDTLLTTSSRPIAEVAMQAMLPTIGPNELATGGGLLAYGVNRLDMFRRAAYYVDRILKGARPADLPVELPTRFDFVVNLKTAGRLALKVPESVLLRADRVIA